jgi:hypothetical protein
MFPAPLSLRALLEAGGFDRREPSAIEAAAHSEASSPFMKLGTILALAKIFARYMPKMLKLAALAQGGNSLKVSSFWPTSTRAGTQRSGAPVFLRT